MAQWSTGGSLPEVWLDGQRGRTVWSTGTRRRGDTGTWGHREDAPSGLSPAPNGDGQKPVASLRAYVCLPLLGTETTETTGCGSLVLMAMVTCRRLSRSNHGAWSARSIDAHIVRVIGITVVPLYSYGCMCTYANPNPSHTAQMTPSRCFPRASGHGPIIKICVVTGISVNERDL